CRRSPDVRLHLSNSGGILALRKPPARATLPVMGESGENSGVHPVDATESTLTRADVLRLMSERDLRRAVDNGWLTRLRRGAYRLNVTMLQLRMHLIAARAPEAVFALLIAAHAWGLRKTVPRD